ncbi:MAG TPA: EF-hand domain-containing protein [Allosphingosinicella sp.]|jgi:hypothetical protein
MNKSVFFGAVAAVLLAAPAAAQPQSDGGRVIDRAQVQSRVQAMFARVDADRDGFVTQAEAEAARTAVRAQRQQRRGERRQALFARLDADGNGAISRAEFDAPRGPRADGERAQRGERGERRAQRFHRRGPGFAGRGPRGGMRGGFGAQGFTRMDVDRDGRVSLAEATRFRLEQLDRLDANDDGRISRDEVQAIRAQRRQAR